MTGAKLIAGCKESTVTSDSPNHLQLDELEPYTEYKVVVAAHLGSLNMSWDLGGGNGTSIVPLVLTRLATNWLNSTLASMQEYYSAGTSDANQTVSDFVSKIAASAVQDIINPAANLCLSS